MPFRERRCWRPRAAHLQRSVEASKANRILIEGQRENCPRASEAVLPVTKQECKTPTCIIKDAPDREHNRAHHQSNKSPSPEHHACEVAVSCGTRLKPSRLIWPKPLLPHRVATTTARPQPMFRPERPSSVVSISLALHCEQVDMLKKLQATPQRMPPWACVLQAAKCNELVGR